MPPSAIRSTPEGQLGPSTAIDVRKQRVTNIEGGERTSMATKKGGSGRDEREVGGGRYVPKGTEKKQPEKTVTEPRKPRKN